MYKTACRIALAIGTVIPAIMFLSPGAANASTGSAAKTSAVVSAARPVAIKPARPATTSDGCVSAGGITTCSYTVHPRVGRCGGFDGTIWWQDDNFGTEYIGLRGKVWSKCHGAIIYVHLAWEQDMGLTGGNVKAGHARGDRSAKVNYEKVLIPGIGGVSSVHSYVCSSLGGWHCGKSKYV